MLEAAASGEVTACAIDSRALYIVSGDKDLLVLGSFEGIKMVTARDFCNMYLAYIMQRAR